MGKYQEFYDVEKVTFVSSDSKSNIVGFIFKPKSGEIRGVFQLCHGMCEYMRRYDEFAGMLCKNGYVFCGHDQLGHGESVATHDDLGYTADGGGADFWVEDAHKMTSLIREKYPDKPIILAGHSMGSFIARAYLSRYPNEKLAAAVIIGTAGPQSATALGKAIAKFLMKTKGERYRSVFLKNLSFMGYNKKYPKGSTPCAWISSDTAIVDKYEHDEYCQFVFTVRAYYDLFSLLEEVSTTNWAAKLPANLPIFLISGGNDPVGQYGRGVCTVYERMRKAGMEKVSVKIYSEARHEILNEKDREKIYADIVRWLDKIIVQE